MAKLYEVLMRDTRANQPAAATSNRGSLYCVTDESDILEQSDGSDWLSYSPTGGGGGTIDTIDMADIAVNRSGIGHNGGDYTFGIRISINQPVTMTGAKFTWDGYASKTVKWTLWDAGYDASGTTSLETGTVSVTTSGVYTITFSSSHTLTVGKYYTLALYEQGGANYQANTTSVPFLLDSFPSGLAQRVTVGPITYADCGMYSAGDAQPTTTGGGSFWPMQFIFSN